MDRREVAGGVMVDVRLEGGSRSRDTRLEAASTLQAERGCGLWPQPTAPEFAVPRGYGELGGVGVESWRCTWARDDGERLGWGRNGR